MLRASSRIDFVPFIVSLFAALCCSGLICPQLKAQDIGSEKEPEVVDVSASGKALGELNDLRIEIEALDQEIADLRAGLPDDATEAQREAVDAQIAELVQSRDRISQQFVELATGVLSEDLTTENKQLTLQEQFQRFLQPLFEAWDDATANPREIENLKADIQGLKARQVTIRSAIVNLEGLIESATGALRVSLEEELESWQADLRRIKTTLNAKQRQLENRQAGNKGFIAGASDAIQDFFRSRGFNILIAGLVFAVVFFVLRKLYPVVRRISPMHRGEKSLFTRLVDVLYTAFNIILAFVGAMVALFFAGDWLLLSICILILLALAWGARRSIPPFLDEIRLILNIGPVREGERVIYEGIPWKVTRLALYTRLVNPELAGGLVRIPAKVLLGYVSRPWEKDEPWFPCSKGDWVILSDDTYGRVIMQTPEYVQIIEQGGARKTFPTQEFLSLSPRNLSANFRVKSTFGIDYEHQAICTTEASPIFEKALTEALSKHLAKENLVNISVPFASAGASSLDFEVLADFKGEAGGLYPKLSRYIQQVCVDVCNEQGWGIPFQQITIHQAATASDEV